MYHKVDLQTKHISRIGVNAYYSRVQYDVDERITYFFESGNQATLAFDNKSDSLYVDGDVTLTDLQELLTTYKYYNEPVSY